MRHAILCVLLLGMLSACGRSDSSNEQETGTQAQSQPSPDTQTPSVASARPAAFGLCVMCHSDVRGKNGLGPSLHGVVGRAAGSVPGFAYSPAMKAANLTWDEATLDRYMENPRAMIPGTKMSYAGLKDATKRAQIIAYLETLK